MTLLMMASVYSPAKLQDDGGVVVGSGLCSPQPLSHITYWLDVSRLKFAPGFQAYKSSKMLALVGLGRNAWQPKYSGADAGPATFP